MIQDLSCAPIYIYLLTNQSLNKVIKSNYLMITGFGCVKNYVKI